MMSKIRKDWKQNQKEHKTTANAGDQRIGAYVAGLCMTKVLGDL